MADHYVGVSTLNTLEKFAKNYNDFLTTEIRSRLSACSSVLDFGAGNGFFAERLNRTEFSVEAFEPDNFLRGEIARRGVTLNPMIEPQAAQFDGLYSLNVFEHIEDDVSALKQALTCVRQGGVVLIYVPAMPSAYSKFDRRIGHFRRYTKKSLKELASCAGIDVHSTDYVDPLGLLLAWAFKGFGLSSEPNPASVWVFDRIVFPVSMAIGSITRGKLPGKNLLLVGFKAS